MYKEKSPGFLRESMLSGYRHHPYTLEQDLAQKLDDGQWKELSDYALSVYSLSLETYADILAPDRLRAMKNSLICLTSVLSRRAIRQGVLPEISFTASDHYINEIEMQNTPRQLQQVLERLLEEYGRLEEDVRVRRASIPLGRALAYIKEHIYGPCRVADAAGAAGYNPQYFAVVFRQETGQSPSEYIREQKLQEAATLLRGGFCTAAEAAQSLGYCSASHFSREFTRFFGLSPRQFLKNGGIALQNQK